MTMIILSKEKKESNREGGREVRKGRGGEKKKKEEIKKRKKEELKKCERKEKKGERSGHSSTGIPSPSCPEKL